MTEQSAGQPFPAHHALVLGFGGVAVLMSGLLGWGVLASISGAVIVSGRVAVETRNQVVENFDGGTVSEILVRDGDSVAQGDVLLRFSDALLRAEEALLTAQYAELAAQRGRLEAEFQNASAIVWDSELVALSTTDPKVREILDGQTRLFQVRAGVRAGEAAQLRERIGQAHEQIAGLEAQAVSVDRQRQLIARELTMRRMLFERGLASSIDLLGFEREATRLDGQAGATAAAIARVQSEIAELEIQLLQIGVQQREDAEAEARGVQARENQVRERLASLHDRLGNRQVRAPVAGEVLDMTVVALGEVVRPGDPILLIVPKDTGLVVIAQVDPIHVDQVYEGQEAVLRFSSFPARETPEVDGYVVRVSADAVPDVESGLSWYEVELVIGKAGQAGQAEDTPNPLSLAGDLVVTPGMPVEVHIRTGERSVLNYLIKPLTDFFYRSLRE